MAKDHSDSTDDSTVNLRAMTARLQVLADAAHDFAGSSDRLPLLLTLIAQRLGTLVGDLCLLVLVDVDGETLKYGAVYHSDPQIVELARALLTETPMRVGDGVAGKVIATGAPVYFPEVAPLDIAALAGSGHAALALRLDVGSLIAVPLISRSRVLGSLSLARRRGAPAYTQEDQALIADLGDRAALAIDNASLVANLEDRVARRTAALSEARDRAEEAVRAKTAFLATR